MRGFELLTDEQLEKLEKRTADQAAVAEHHVLGGALVEDHTALLGHDERLKQLERAWLKACHIKYEQARRKGTITLFEGEK